jgi:hypothetical protein
MLKNILNLDGAQQLSKNEQKEINGGLKMYRGTCEYNNVICPEGTHCVDTTLYGPQCKPDATTF